MKSLFGAIFIVLAATLLTLRTAPNNPSEKKYFKRAMIVSGDNLNTAKFLGMVDAATSMNKPIDVIVGSCGGSIAAALVNAIPNPDQRLQFLRSKEYYEMLKSISVYDIGIPEFISKFFDLKDDEQAHLASHNNKENKFYKDGKHYHQVPSIFDFSLVLVNNEFERPPLTQHFLKDGIRAIIVSARAEFQPKDAGMIVPHDQKLFTEVYFTDPDTAGALAGLPSLVGKSDATSAINEGTQVITDASLAQATRASVADPRLVLPEKIGDQYFLSGALNIDPINVGKYVAEEVIAQYKDKYDTIVSTPTLESTFYFSANKIRTEVMSSDADYWVDFTKGNAPGLDPGPKLGFYPLVKFKVDIPKKYEDYLKIVDAQYKFGWDRTVEALSMAPHSKGHIRAPYSH